MKTAELLEKFDASGMPFVVKFLNVAGIHGYGLADAQRTAEFMTGFIRLWSYLLTVVPGTPLYRAIEKLLAYIRKFMEESDAMKVTVIYLAGADSFALSAKRLLEMIALIKKYLPNTKVITMYARTDNIASKPHKILINTMSAFVGTQLDEDV